MRAFGPASRQAAKHLLTSRRGQVPSIHATRARLHVGQFRALGCLTASPEILKFQAKGVKQRRHGCDSARILTPWRPPWGHDSRAVIIDVLAAFFLAVHHADRP